MLMCPKCKRLVPDKVASCPRCGYQIGAGAVVFSKQQNKTTSQEAVQPVRNNRKSNNTAVFIAAIVIAVVFLAAANTALESYQSSANGSSATSAYAPVQSEKTAEKSTETAEPMEAKPAAEPETVKPQEVSEPEQPKKPKFDMDDYEASIALASQSIHDYVYYRSMMTSYEWSLADSEIKSYDDDIRAMEPSGADAQTALNLFHDYDALYQAYQTLRNAMKNPSAYSMTQAECVSSVMAAYDTVAEYYKSIGMY